MDIQKLQCAQAKNNFMHCGYPETISSFTVEELMLPMRDQVCMRTVCYKPDGLSKFPVIFRRTCYPNDEAIIAIVAENMVKRGYGFVYQFCRGTGGSEGEWKPNVNERNDGIDTIDWLYEQPWCDGIGYWGLSYASLTGWAFADAVKGKVKSMFLLHYGTDRFVSAYHKGLFHHDILTGWSMQNAGWPVTADYKTSCRYMPQLEVDETLWGGKLPWYREYITNEFITDDYWQSGWWKQLREIPSKVEIPLYIVSGWYDHHHESTMNTWRRLNPDTQKMSWFEIGGWNHGLQPVLQDKDVSNLDNNEPAKALKWFELTLKENKIPEEKIRYYVPGKNTWDEAASWEEIPRQNEIFYLHADQTLSIEKGTNDSKLEYTYDPENPVPSHGGDCILCSWPETGSLLQNEPNWRSDVISFVSDPLEKDFTINGQINVHLWVQSDCKNTAFVAHIDELTKENKSYHIRTSVTTLRHELPAGETYTPNSPIKVTIDMSDICYCLRAGSRIRIDITSSDFPQYHVHSNQEGNWAVATENKIAHQSILLGKTYPSYVEIPVIK